MTNQRRPETFLDFFNGVMDANGKDDEIFRIILSDFLAALMNDNHKKCESILKILNDETKKEMDVMTKKLIDAMGKHPDCQTWH